MGSTGLFCSLGPISNKFAWELDPREVIFWVMPVPTRHAVRVSMYPIPTCDHAISIGPVSPAELAMLTANSATDFAFTGAFMVDRGIPN